ncbi:MAG TPA: hypothetical protein VHV74_18595, partial [Pseudonocardiaceae bacterium]|nr:hypothetical protein [Pseudonocardiaceae bacterium]
MLNPDRSDIKETYVHATTDVEQLDPATWVVVSGNWCLVALYGPEVAGEPVPDFATLPEARTGCLTAAT